MLHVVRSTGYSMESMSEKGTDAGRLVKNNCSDLDKRSCILCYGGAEQTERNGQIYKLWRAKNH